MNGSWSKATASGTVLKSRNNHKHSLAPTIWTPSTNFFSKPTIFTQYSRTYIPYPADAPTAYSPDHSKATPETKHQPPATSNPLQTEQPTLRSKHASQSLGRSKMLTRHFSDRSKAGAVRGETCLDIMIFHLSSKRLCQGWFLAVAEDETGSRLHSLPFLCRNSFGRE